MISEQEQLLRAIVFTLFPDGQPIDSLSDAVHRRYPQLTFSKHDLETALSHLQKNNHVLESWNMKRLRLTPKARAAGQKMALAALSYGTPSTPTTSDHHLATTLAFLDFLGAFECVFDDDWEHTKGCIDSDVINCFIAEEGTFLNPGVADETSDWWNRGGLLRKYRALRQEVMKQCTHPCELCAHIRERTPDDEKIPF